MSSMPSMLDECMLVTLSGDILSLATTCPYNGSNQSFNSVIVHHEQLQNGLAKTTNRYLLVIGCKRGLCPVIA
jgi:hypothetical protein